MGNSCPQRWRCLYYEDFWEIIRLYDSGAGWDGELGHYLSEKYYQCKTCTKNFKDNNNYSRCSNCYIPHFVCSNCHTSDKNK